MSSLASRLFRPGRVLGYSGMLLAGLTLTGCGGEPPPAETTAPVEGPSASDVSSKRFDETAPPKR